MICIVVEFGFQIVIIGFDQLFVVIGECINLIGCKILNVELEVGNFECVKVDVIVQVEVGVIILDINLGVVFSNKMVEDVCYVDNNFVELELMCQLVEVV